MPAHSSRIYIDGKQVDFTSGTLTKDGGNTASRLNFVIPGENSSMRKYWNKEVTFFCKDNGEGIPKEKQDQLFKKYGQVKTGAKRNCTSYF